MISKCACCLYLHNFFPRMTKFDIRNYFEKIYGVKVAKVNTRIQLGEIIKGNHSLGN